MVKKTSKLEESIPIEVAKDILRREKYSLAVDKHLEEDLNRIKSDHLDIVKITKVKSFNEYKKHKPEIIGKIKFNDPNDISWSVDAYGKENLSELTDLIEDLTKKYKSKSKITLSEEESQYVSLSSESFESEKEEE